MVKEKVLPTERYCVQKKYKDIQRCHLSVYTIFVVWSKDWK